MERSKVRDNVFGFFAVNFTESGYGIGQVNDFTAGVNGRKHSREYAAFCYYAGYDKMPDSVKFPAKKPKTLSLTLLRSTQYS